MKITMRIKTIDIITNININTKTHEYKTHEYKTHEYKTHEYKTPKLDKTQNKSEIVF